MIKPTENSKPGLELRELELKVRELELNVRELEKPSYKKLSYWTTIVTVLIAIFGFGLQSYLSSIKNAKADLDTRIAEAKKDTLDRQIRLYNDSLAKLTHKSDSALKAYNQISQAYIAVKSIFAFTNDTLSVKSQNKISNVNEKVSGVLLKNNLSSLLKGAIVRIYYLPAMKEKAREMNKILIDNGVQSNLEAPSYDISNSLNKIVYYNDRQLDYCKAVQALLNKNGWANFKIRPSSGANVSTQFFKIYLTGKL